MNAWFIIILHDLSEVEIFAKSVRWLDHDKILVDEVITIMFDKDIIEIK